MFSIITTILIALAVLFGILLLIGIGCIAFSAFLDDLALGQAGVVFCMLSIQFLFGISILGLLAYAAKELLS